MVVVVVRVFLGETTMILVPAACFSYGQAFADAVFHVVDVVVVVRL